MSINRLNRAGVTQALSHNAELRRHATHMRNTASVAVEAAQRDVNAWNQVVALCGSVDSWLRDRLAIIEEQETKS